jgi:iron(III) transport system substrate-binding protein
MRRFVAVLCCLALLSGVVFAGGAKEAPAAAKPAAPAAAAAPKKVVLYTAHEDAIVNGMVPLFEKESGIKVEYVKMASGDVIKRVVAEQANVQCDVIWSIGGEQLEANNAILAPYTPKDWDKVNPIFKVGTNWLPYTGIMNVFVVSTKMLKEGQYPKSWTDLGDARFAKMISTARPDKSGSAYMQLANVLTIYKDKGWEVYKAILKNAVVSNSSGAVPKFVNDGELSVGITLEDNAYRFVLGGGPVKIVYPADGAVAAPDGLALVKGAPNAEAGKIFIDWCLSKSTQEYLMDKMFRRPVRTDCKEPAGLPSVKEIKTVPYDFAWAAANQKDFVKKFTDMAMELGL